MLVVCFLLNNCVKAQSPAQEAFDLRLAGKTIEAIKLLENAAAADSNDTAVYFELARDYFYTLIDCPDYKPDDVKQRQKTMKVKLKKAQKAIDKAIKLDGKNARYHYWAGEVETYNAIYDAHFVWTMPAMPFETRNAIKNYQKALEIDPNFHQARLALMGCYDRLPPICGGDKKKAEHHARELELLDAVCGAKARCEIQPRKNRQEKIAIWQKIVEQYPDNARAHIGLAREYMHNGDLPQEDMQKSVEHINKALKLDSSTCNILLNLAHHYKRAKKYDKAEEAISQFINIKPQPCNPLLAIAYRQIADVQRKQGKKQEAEISLEKANKLEPMEWPTSRLPNEDLFIAP
jgi:tetratricopeptide (TPR) repeat protein